MPALDRRVLLTKLVAGVSFSLAGCQSKSADGPSNVTNSSEDPTSSPSPSGTDEQTAPTPIEPNLESECITSEFEGYVGTTPISAPERPDELASSSVIDYAVAYEQYYERYLALYETGPPTPETENHPAHGFPDVRLADLETDAVTERENGYVVHFTFSRIFENDDRGAYTVTYYISEEYTIRAEAEGIEHPGPDPLTAGTIMSC